MSEEREEAPLPQIDAAQAVEVITGFIGSQLAQTGFSRLVVGLSGGVDSATTAFLAARAVGPENLLAVRMPYSASSRRIRIGRAFGGRGAWLPDRAGGHQCHGRPNARGDCW